MRGRPSSSSMTQWKGLPPVLRWWWVDVNVVVRKGGPAPSAVPLRGLRAHRHYIQQAGLTCCCCCCRRRRWSGAWGHGAAPPCPGPRAACAPEQAAAMVCWPAAAAAAWSWRRPSSGASGAGSRRRRSRRPPGGGGRNAGVSFFALPCLRGAGWGCCCRKKMCVVLMAHLSLQPAKSSERPVGVCLWCGQPSDWHT